MYMFCMLSLPLSFLALTAWTPRAGAVDWRAFARGLLLGVPSMLVWMILEPLYRPVWGSPLLVLSFLAKYWVLPFGLTTATFAVAAGFGSLSRGTGHDRLAAYVAGSISVFGAANAVISWGEPSRVYMLAIPCMVAASALAFPALLEEAARDGMPDALKPMGLALGGFVVASLGAALFFMRLQWLGLIVTLVYSAGAAWLGYRRLAR